MQESLTERELLRAVNGLSESGPPVDISEKKKPFALLHFQFGNGDENSIQLKLFHGTANIRPLCRQEHWEESLNMGKVISHFALPILQS
jgi:hypothetical protein